MYSKYLHSIKLRQEPISLFEGGQNESLGLFSEETKNPSSIKVVGGVPLQSFLEISGAGSKYNHDNHEGLKKIAHLSVPVGLVYFRHDTYKATYYDKDSDKESDKDSDKELYLIDEKMFNQLFESSASNIRQKKNRQTSSSKKEPTNKTKIQKTRKKT